MRDQCGAETEKPSDPAKTENEGILRIPPRTRVTGLASSFSLTEKLAARMNGHDERKSKPVS